MKHGELGLVAVASCLCLFHSVGQTFAVRSGHVMAFLYIDVSKAVFVSCISLPGFVQQRKMIDEVYTCICPLFV